MNIGFLGVGRMGSALAATLSEAREYEKIFAYDLRISDELQEQLPNVSFVANARELEEQAELLVLCVKPQDMASALATLKGDKHYVSIAAGLTIAKLCGYLQTTSSCIARVMPNICVLTSSAVSAIYCESDSLANRVEAMFRLVGMTLRIAKEEQLHAITALSGSGPALVAAFAEAMAAGGAVHGIDQNTSLQLTLQTMQGVLDLLQKKGMSPNQLREQVASPAGTTMSALHYLSKHDFHNIVIAALAAAVQRSQELELQ